MCRRYGGLSGKKPLKPLREDIGYQKARIRFLIDGDRVICTDPDVALLCRKIIPRSRSNSYNIPK